MTRSGVSCSASCMASWPLLASPLTRIWSSLSRSASALQRLNAQRPDLAFVDIGLPGRTGILLTRDIKAIDAKVYVVMLTSHDLPEYREAAFREGADWYICKMADQCRDEIIDRVARFGLRASRRRTGRALPGVQESPRRCTSVP
jgi:DNA-binding NarL/FixJ family response regulator